MENNLRSCAPSPPSASRFHRKPGSWTNVKTTSAMLDAASAHDSSSMLEVRSDNRCVFSWSFLAGWHFGFNACHSFATEQTGL